MQKIPRFYKKWIDNVGANYAAIKRRCIRESNCKLYLPCTGSTCVGSMQVGATLFHL